VANKLVECTVAASIGKDSFMKQAQGYQCVSKHQKIRKKKKKNKKINKM
jgi:hypothetical protein